MISKHYKMGAFKGRTLTKNLQEVNLQKVKRKYKQPSSLARLGVIFSNIFLYGQLELDLGVGGHRFRLHLGVYPDRHFDGGIWFV